MSMLMQEAVNFATVLLAAVCIASAVSVLYAFGLRFWARASSDVLTLGHLHMSEASSHHVHVIARLAAALCFAACVAIVLFALWLMIPVFHTL